MRKLFLFTLQVIGFHLALAQNGVCQNIGVPQGSGGAQGDCLKMSNGSAVPGACASGGAPAFREFLICAPGNSAAGLCHTFTNLGASFTEVSNSASRNHVDLSGFTDFRIIAQNSVAATTGDIVIQCDADAAFGSVTNLGSIDNPGTSLNLGAWTAIPAGECKTTGGQYIRAGMANGNGTEDPAIRWIRLQVR